MRTKFTIDAADADQICDKCLDVANSMGASVSIAIVDESGSLLRFARMDPAGSHTIDLAQRKARAAAIAVVSTRMIQAAVEAGKLMNIDAIGWGGVPLKTNGECVGGIGVSGSSAEADEEIAGLGAAAFVERQSKAR